MKVKKYKNYPNMLLCNESTLNKLQVYDIDIFKIYLITKTIKDFKIVIRPEIKDNMVYFYINRLKDGEILEVGIDKILK